MRRMSVLVFLVSFLALSSFAQRPVLTPSDTRTPGPPQRCCARIYDASGKLVGDVIRWDDRFPQMPLNAFVRYPIKGGGDVVLAVAAESITSVQQPGGSVALFTTSDCSGPNMFAMLSWPPLMKRYAMVLPVGSPSTVGFAATNAWLFVTDPLPSRVDPVGTVFHSQWGESGSCVPYPAPGYTVVGTPFGGYWMKRVEDLYAKYKRPFYSE